MEQIIAAMQLRVTPMVGKKVLELLFPGQENYG